ncbi:DnaJ domain containing protein [Striga asiatica]|uniref:DnaJ domain containing protein n=1 Tax=Striga asiatica TaxID=4170 RepID=A0A5A7PPG1_STRAF|nr:DnaJ domain containing protein [Striga asiatica]
MECNKDEAVRAMELAENKMEKTDFEAARRMALKARNLYPELENINRMLSICEVHCSAQKLLIGSEKDWYEILQVDKLADVLTVKKQYRRLALILHPDKNRFPGAEGAFKLIGEANMILSDPVKKSLYDGKLRSSAILSAPANPHVDKNPPVNKQHSAGNNVSNGNSSMGQHQANNSNSSSVAQVFWTCCPFCKMRYQYPRQYVQRNITCPGCKKVFVAYEVIVSENPSRTKSKTQCAAQNVHSRPDLSQPAAFHEKSVPNTGNCKMGFQKGKGSPDNPSRTKSKTQCAAQNVHSRPDPSRPAAVHEKSIPNTGNSKMGFQKDKVSPASQEQSQAAASRENVKPETYVQKGTPSEDIKVAGATKNEKISKVNETDNRNTSSLHRDQEVGTANGDDASYKETQYPKNKSRKRARKESSERCDASTGPDFKDLASNKGSAGEFATDSKFESVEVCPPQKPLTKKQHVLHNETEVDDLTDPPLNKPQAAKDNNASDNPKNAHRNSSPDVASCRREEILRDGEDLESVEKSKVGGETCGKTNNSSDGVEIESDWDEDTLSSDVVNIECPDPEFSDFDKVREESQFEVGQFWACYDTLDDLPRFYAKVKKIFSSPFELSITWLEAVPINKLYVEWVDEELPVGCGSFKLCHTEKAARLSFSHRVHVEKGKKRGSLLLYPREGEVWAIFKDWDISWSVDPNNHKKNFKYEIVEVLSDFVENYGIKVGWLDKIDGFVSLFQRGSQDEKGLFVIGANELYRFSHCVPCFKMTGLEREGVPKGAFELDPAALPLNPDHLFYPGKGKVVHGRDKSVLSEGTSTDPKDYVDLEEIDHLEDSSISKNAV